MFAASSLSQLRFRSAFCGCCTLSVGTSLVSVINIVLAVGLVVTGAALNLKDFSLALLTTPQGLNLWAGFGN